MGLSAIGLYASTSYSVSQRTREIGIRMAIGAESWQLGRLVLRRTLRELSIGLMLGVACTISWERIFLTASTTRPSSGPSALSDPINLLAGAGLLVLVGVLACVLPARRATGLDPLTALRYE